MMRLALAFVILHFSGLPTPVYSSSKLPVSEAAFTQFLERQGGSDGLSFEECSGGDCKRPRFCFLVSNPSSICSGAGACFCLPLDLIQCSSHTHCVEGEVCAEVKGTGTVCAAESFVSDNPDVQKLPGEKPQPPPFPSGKGLTFDPCELDTCSSPRFCFKTSNPSSLCGGTGTCSCRPLKLISCSSSRECVDGETCASLPDVGNVCASESYVRHISGGGTEGSSNPAQPASPGTIGSSGRGSQSGPGSVCIGVEFLQHLSRDALQFETDNLASVLCDQNGSCATPGHIVQFHGEPMMMKVNSPIYFHHHRLSV